MPTTRNRFQQDSQKSSSLSASPTQTKKRPLSKTQDPFIETPPDILEDDGDGDGQTLQEPSHNTTAVPPSQEQSEEDDAPPSPKRQRVTPPEAATDSREAESVPDGARSPLAHPAVLIATASKDDNFDKSASPSIPVDPAHQARLDNLATLARLSEQVLIALGKMTPMEALQLQREQSSPAAKHYGQTRSLFDPIRQLYAIPSPFLSAQALGMTDAMHVKAIAKANQALWMSSVFTGERGLRDMDLNFIDIFVPTQGQLLGAHGSIYLALKTQAFITAWRSGLPQLIPIVEELFPLSLQQQILDRRGGSESLTPTEQDFLKTLSVRRESLLADIKNGTLNGLPDRHSYFDFGREVNTYLSQNYGKPAVPQPAGSTREHAAPSQPQNQMQGEFSIHKAPMAKADATNGLVPLPASQQVSSPELNEPEYVRMAARAAAIAMQASLPEYAVPPPPVQPALQTPPVRPPATEAQNQSDSTATGTAAAGIGAANTSQVHEKLRESTQETPSVNGKDGGEAGEAMIDSVASQVTVNTSRA